VTVWYTTDTESIQHVAQQDQCCEGIALLRREERLRPARLRAAVDNGDEKRADVWDIREVFPLVQQGGRRPNGGTVLHNVYATSDDNHQFAILYSCHVTFVCSWLEIFVTSATSCYGQPAVPHGS